MNDESGHNINDKLEDMSVGYQAAVQLAIYDGQLSWQVTSIFIQFAILTIAGAIFPSFVGSKNALVLAVAGLAISFGGIIMTSMFGSMAMRIRAYEECWFRHATHYEAYLDHRVKTLQSSVLLSKEGNVKIGDDFIHMPRIAAIESKTMLRALFLCFLCLFLGLFIMNLWRLVSLISG
jgi:hypothetical protein